MNSTEEEVEELSEAYAEFRGKQLLSKAVAAGVTQKLHPEIRSRGTCFLELFKIPHDQKSCKFGQFGHSEDILKAGWVEVLNYLITSPYVPPELTQHVEPLKAYLYGKPPSPATSAPQKSYSSPSPSNSFSTPLSRFNPPSSRASEGAQKKDSMERTTSAPRGILRSGSAVRSMESESKALDREPEERPSTRFLDDEIYGMRNEDLDLISVSRMGHVKESGVRVIISSDP